MEQVERGSIPRPVRTRFDNDNSLLYKWAQYYGVPSRYMVIRDTLEGREYIPISELLRQRRLRDLDVEIPLGTSDLAMMYAVFGHGSPAAVLEEINTYVTEQSRQLKGAGYISYSSLDELVDRYQSQQREWPQLLERDQTTLQAIETAIDTIQEIPPCRLSPLILTLIELQAHPSWSTTSRPVQPEDGITLFNQSILSIHAPYVCYVNSKGELFSKVWAEGHPLANIVLPGYEPDTIHVTLWTGEKQTSKESFISVSYALARDGKPVNTLLAPVDLKQNITPEDVQGMIHDVFPMLTLGVITETRVHGEHLIYGPELIENRVSGYHLNELALVEMLLNSSLVNNYLYLDEVSAPYSLKKRVQIHYRTVTLDVGEATSAATLVFNQYKSTDAAEVPLIDVAGAAILPPETHYLRLLLNADSREQARQCIEVVSRLLTWVRDHAEEALAPYFERIPHLNPDKITLIKEKNATITGDVGKALPTASQTRIQRLQVEAKHIFVDGYARICQAPRQPEIVTREEAERISQETFPDRKTSQPIHRQYMLFPPNEFYVRDGPRVVKQTLPPGTPQYYFVCPNEEHPFPGVKLNTLRENRDVYPYVPCCSKNDQMDVKSNSFYNEFIRGKIKKRKSTQKQTHIIHTEKSLTFGRIGDLSQTLETLLSEAGGKKLVRYGTLRSPSSLLHCVLTALSHENVPHVLPELDGRYLAMSEEDKEEYAGKVRRIIASTILPSVMQQEMWDVSDASRQLADPEVFLDPSKFYRALEEFFNINLYVFIPGEDKQHVFEVPRNKACHLRPYRDRRTVLILKHRGAPSEALDRPQCELVCDFRPKESDTKFPRDKDFVFFFGRAINELVYGAFYSTYLLVAWEFDPTLTARDNPYVRVDYQALFSNQIDAQILDIYGKLRCVIVKGIPVYTPPSQPLNVPVVTETRGVSAEVAMALLGKPSKVVPGQGLWFPLLDWEEGLYIPAPDAVGNGLPTAEPPLLIRPPSMDRVARFRKLKKNASIVVQLNTWLYLLACNQTKYLGREERVFVPVDAFLQDYVRVVPPLSDSANMYDFSMLPHRLPDVREADQAVAWLSERAPTFSNGTKILIHAALLDRIRGYLDSYVRTWFLRTAAGTVLTPRERETLPVPTELQDIFTEETDFLPQQGVVVLLGERNLFAWMRSLSIQRVGLPIASLLSMDYAIRNEPYLYTAHDKVYIIQNLRSPVIDVALTAVRGWRQNQTNLGMYTPAGITVRDPYVVYGIAVDGGLAVAEDHSRGSEDYLQVLNYMAGEPTKQPSYAALLPIL